MSKPALAAVGDRSTRLEDIPSFARPTASRIALTISREPGVELITDLHSKEAAVARALRHHEKSQQADKAENPGRYSVTRKSSNSEMISPSSPPTSPSRLGQLSSPRFPDAVVSATPTSVTILPSSSSGVIRSVTVRSVEGDDTAIARMRASRDMARVNSRGGNAGGTGGAMQVEPPTGGEGAGGAGDVLLEGQSSHNTLTAPDSVYSVPPRDAAGQAAAVKASISPSSPSASSRIMSTPGPLQLGPGKVLDILNGCVLEGLSGNPALRRFDTNRPPAFSFAECYLLRKEIEDGDVVKVLTACKRFNLNIATACLLSPRGFYHVVNFLFPFLTALSEDSPVFAEVAELFKLIGNTMVSQDTARPESPVAAGSGEETVASGFRKAATAVGSESTAAGLFRDYLLPPLAEMLKRKPSKRATLIQLAYTFTVRPNASDSGPLVSLINTLQDAVHDMDAFLHCISVIATLQTNKDVSGEL